MKQNETVENVSHVNEEPTTETSPPDEVYACKKGLNQILEQLCLKHGWVQKGKPKIISLAKLLSSSPCDRQISYALHSPEPREENRFDPYYSEKSSFATSLIIEHLKRRLSEEGFKSNVIRTEDQSDFGIYDITIEEGNPCRIYHHGVEKIRIEVKASLGIPLEQIGRYLLDDSTLIVGRIITKHAVSLKPSQHRNFVLFSLETMVARAERLLKNELVVVPGRYCANCLDFDCQFNKNKSTHTRPRIITMNNDEFKQDIDAFFGNLKEVSEKIAVLVLQELRESKPLTVGKEIISK